MLWQFMAILKKDCGSKWIFSYKDTISLLPIVTKIYIWDISHVVPYTNLEYEHQLLKSYKRERNLFFDNEDE
jgi:hypothetical protein